MVCLVYLLVHRQIMVSLLQPRLLRLGAANRVRQRLGPLLPPVEVAGEGLHHGQHALGVRLVVVALLVAEFGGDEVEGLAVTDAHVVRRVRHEDKP